MDAIALAAIAAGASGLLSAVARLITHSLAERSLVASMKSRQNELRELESLRASLEAGTPDPELITRARQILQYLAGSLTEKQERDILQTLDQGSDKSKANYIVKVLDQVDETAA